ncbi:MAG: hypothetical protein D6806_08875 [Deltaproteobacteria bacterium]|nr:MAG: hypothetical protein D6806_08875 [Deltaproteobacteria bacterium]
MTADGDGSSGDGQEADVPVLGGCRLFPPDNMWNTRVDTFDVHPRSAEYIASIGADKYLHPDFGTTWQGAPNGIPYDIVPEDQPLVAVTFDYADESDPGPYPIPPDASIEGGPDGDGDRHVLILQQGACVLYELFNAWPQPDGSWHAGSGAIWHLDRNEQRPAGWTSADAAGLAILPGLVRWEEVYEQGRIKHAIRVTLRRIQRAYIPPASHSDGRCGSDPSCPPMGLRLRLKASFDESGFPEPLQVILRAMKEYGLVVADTGGDMFISGVPDERWDDDVLHQLHQVTADNFEAVYTGDAIPY